MSAYLPPTDNLPNFNPSVFQSGDDTGITLSEADSRYVKKSGSIMTGSLSTPALLVNTINVEDELAKIGNIETATTGITYDNTGDIDKTTIDNNVEITGLFVLPNHNDVDDTLTDLNTSTTNLTFNSALGRTILSNDLHLATGKQLVINSSGSSVNIGTAIGNLQTYTTGITYDNTGSADKTTIDNNVTVSSGKNLVLGSTNVGTEISNLLEKTNGIAYDDSTGQDTTTIENNLKIITGKNLLLDTTNVGTELSKITALETKTQDLTYDVLNGTSLYVNNVLGTQNHGNVDTKLTTLDGEVDDLQEATTKLTYSNNNIVGGTEDLSTLDCNVTISASKNLLLGTTNVGTELNKISPIETKTTKVSFTTDGTTDVTAVSGILNITGTEPLMIRYGATDEVNVERSITNLETKTTGIAYMAASDRTLLSKDVKIQIGKTLYLGDDSVNEILTGITHDSTTVTTVINKLRVTNPMESLATYRSRFCYSPDSVSNNTWGNNNYPDTISSSSYIGSTTPEIYYDTGGKIRFASTGTYKVICHMNVDCITMPSGDRTVFGAYVSTNGSSNKFRNTSGTNAGVWGVCYLRRSKTTTNGLMAWTGSFDISDYISVTSTNDYVTINTRMYFNSDSNLNFTNTSSVSNYDVWCYVEVEKISATTSMFTAMPTP